MVIKSDICYVFYWHLPQDEDCWLEENKIRASVLLSMCGLPTDWWLIIIKS